MSPGSRSAARLVVALLLVAAALSHPGRVAAKSLLLLPDLFPSAPVRPLSLLAPAPWRETLSYDYVAGRVEADIYHPADAGPHGAVILELGARPLPRRDPVLVRLADGLARAGAVVMIPESDNLLAGRVLPEEREALILAFERLSALDDVDAAQVGFVGFSVGGGLSTLAATDPRIRDRVAFVNTVGAYFDARALLTEIAARSLLVDGLRQPWQPSPLTLEVIGWQLIETLEQPSDREALATLVRRGQPLPADRTGLSPQAQAVLRLLQGVNPAEVPMVLEALPAPALARLGAISPIDRLGELRAGLYVMHDADDSYIPYSQSRHLVALAPPSLRLYTELSILEHVVPSDRVVPIAFAADLARLYRHLFAIGLEFL